MDYLPRKPEGEVMDLQAEAKAYAEADFHEVNQAFVERLVQLAPQKKAAAIDFGTGPADIPIRLIRLRPQWHVMAVDASQPMLDYARSAIARAGMDKSIELVRADAKATNLPPASFDVLFSNSILHHVEEPVAMWREMKRLARSGALVFIRDLARPASQRQAGDIVKQYAGQESALLREEYYRSLIAAYTIQEVRGQLLEAGLQQLTVERVTDRHMDIFGRL